MFVIRFISFPQDYRDKKFPISKVMCSHWFNLLLRMRKAIRTFFFMKNYAYSWTLTGLPFWSQIIPVTGLAMLL